MLALNSIVSHGNPLSDCHFFVLAKVGMMLMKVITTAYKVEPTMSLVISGKVWIDIREYAFETLVGFETVEPTHADRMSHRVWVLPIIILARAEAHTPRMYIME